MLWWSSNVWAKLVPNRHAISDRYQSRHLLKHPHAGSLSLDGPVPPTNSLANLQPFRSACRQREKRKTRKLIWIVFPYGKSIGRRDGAYQHALLKRWMMSSSVLSFPILLSFIADFLTPSSEEDPLPIIHKFRAKTVQSSSFQKLFTIDISIVQERSLSDCSHIKHCPGIINPELFKIINY